MDTRMKDKAVEILKTSPDIKLVPSITATSSDHGNTGVKHRNGHQDEEHYHHEEHHINAKVHNHGKIITSLMSGAMAGAVAKTTIAPLDRTKINFQTSNRPFSMKQALKFLANTYKTEGVLALWRGNSATIVRIVPYAAIQYAAHEQYKMLLNRNRRKKHLPPKLRFLAGSLAGVTSVACTYPLDMVRARMAVTHKDKYHSLIDALKKICREEGVRTVYRGFLPTMLGSIPYSGTSFFTYETCKIVHAGRTKGRDPTPVERLCFGALAGLLGQSMSYPLDIVRRRMQTAGVTGHSQDYTGIWSTAKKVIAEEGIRKGMYKGLSMNWIKGPIAVGVSFTTFDITLKWLRKLKVFHIDEEG